MSVPYINTDRWDFLLHAKITPRISTIRMRPTTIAIVYCFVEGFWAALVSTQFPFSQFVVAFWLHFESPTKQQCSSSLRSWHWGCPSQTLLLSIHWLSLQRNWSVLQTGQFISSEWSSHSSELSHRHTRGIQCILPLRHANCSGEHVGGSAHVFSSNFKSSSFGHAQRELLSPLATQIWEHPPLLFAQGWSSWLGKTFNATWRSLRPLTRPWMYVRAFPVFLSALEISICSLSIQYRYFPRTAIPFGLAIWPSTNTLRKPPSRSEHSIRCKFPSAQYNFSLWTSTANGPGLPNALENKIILSVPSIDALLIVGGCTILTQYMCLENIKLQD